MNTNPESHPVVGTNGVGIEAMRHINLTLARENIARLERLYNREHGNVKINLLHLLKWHCQRSGPRSEVVEKHTKRTKNKRRRAA